MDVPLGEQGALNLDELDLWRTYVQQLWIKSWITLLAKLVHYGCYDRNCRRQRLSRSIIV